MEKISVVSTKIKKVSADQISDADDLLAAEEPLEMQLSYGSKSKRIQKSISVTMRTPGNDEELCAGFLFTEGIIQSREQISHIDFIEENKMLITLRENEIPNLKNAERNFYTTSSCGVCGKSSIDAIKTTAVYKTYKDTADSICIEADLLYGLPDKLKKQQEIFELTGGLHASVLFDMKGNFILLREDVGRHNALDKIIGTEFLNEHLPLDDNILLLSGRASFELIQKSAMAGIRVIAAVGAPSSLAVRLAEDSGITLIGFLRRERFNIYSGTKRISSRNMTAVTLKNYLSYIF